MDNIRNEMRMGQGLKKYRPRPEVITERDERLRLAPSKPPEWVAALAADIIRAAVIHQTVKVPDYSFWTDRVNFVGLKADGYPMVILRAGQNLWIDTKFIQFYAEAKAAGLMRGAYWFLDSRVKGSQQADMFYELIKDDMPEGPIVADFEENYGGPYGGWNLVYDFMERLKALGVPVKKLMIYSGYYYWVDHRPRTTTQLNYFAQYTWWEAWYTDDPSRVLVPAPFDQLSPTPTLWQFSETYPDIGDCSYWNGDLQSLYDYYGETVPETPPTDPPPPEPPPTPGEETMTSVGQVTVSSTLNVRAVPDASINSVIGSVLNGDILQASAIVDGKDTGGVVVPNSWWKLKKITRNGVDVVELLACHAVWETDGTTDQSEGLIRIVDMVLCQHCLRLISRDPEKFLDLVYLILIFLHRHRCWHGSWTGCWHGPHGLGSVVKRREVLAWFDVFPWIANIAIFVDVSARLFLFVIDFQFSLQCVGVILSPAAIGFLRGGGSQPVVFRHIRLRPQIKRAGSGGQHLRTAPAVQFGFARAGTVEGGGDDVDNDQAGDELQDPALGP